MVPSVASAELAGVCLLAPVSHLRWETCPVSVCSALPLQADGSITPRVPQTTILTPTPLVEPARPVFLLVTGPGWLALSQSPSLQTQNTGLFRLCSVSFHGRLPALYVSGLLFFFRCWERKDFFLCLHCSNNLCLSQGRTTWLPLTLADPLTSASRLLGLQTCHHTRPQ